MITYESIKAREAINRKRAAARATLAHLEQQRKEYITLYRQIENQLNSAPPAKRETLTRRLLTIDTRLFTIDQKRVKLFDLLNGGLTQ